MDSYRFEQHNLLWLIVMMRQQIIASMIACSGRQSNLQLQVMEEVNLGMLEDISESLGQHIIQGVKTSVDQILGFQVSSRP